MRGLNLELERLHQDPERDWRFGSFSLPSLFSIPEALRDLYLPSGEVQVGVEDMQDCATRAPINSLEAQFTYAYNNHLMTPSNRQWLADQGYVVDGRVLFSDAFIAILSGTTRQGNSLKAPLEAIRKHGLVPKSRLPLEKWMTFADYHNFNRITQELRNLGQEFIKRFTINYEQVAERHFGELLKEDMPVVAGHAWDLPINGEYQYSTGPLNHAFLLFKTPRFHAFDNYTEGKDDYIKKLTPDFRFFEYGYRVFVSSETVPQAVPDAAFAWLAKIIAWITGGQKTPMPAIPSEILPTTPTPIPMNKRERIYQEAVKSIGKDVSPNDVAPDELGCVESVVSILQKVVTFPQMTGTATMFAYLKKSKEWKGTLDPTRGNLIISVTGAGNGSIPGHVGIHAGDNWIMSNTSKDGIWRKNYTIAGWINRYRKQGGMKVFYFEPVETVKGGDTIGGMEQDKKFGALSSSVDPQKLSLTVTAAARAIIGLLVSFGLVQATGANTAIEQIPVIIAGGYATWQGVEMLWGAVRKVIVLFYR